MVTTSTTYNNEQYKVQQLYNLFNENSQGEELENTPIQVMNSYGFDIAYTQGIDFNTFEGVLQELWTEAFENNAIEKQTKADSLQCSICKITVFILFIAALNKFLLKYSISQIPQILQTLATREGQKTWGLYMASFTASVGITDNIIGTFQAYLVGGDGTLTLKECINNFLGFCCNKIRLCNTYTMYSGKFVFKNYLGQNIDSGYCRFKCGDLIYQLNLNGLAKGDSSSPKEIQVYADQKQEWTLDVDTNDKIHFTGTINAGLVPQFNDTAELIASLRVSGGEFYVDYQNGSIINGTLKSSDSEA